MSFLDVAAIAGTAVSIGTQLFGSTEAASGDVQLGEAQQQAEQYNSATALANAQEQQTNVDLVSSAGDAEIAQMQQQQRQVTGGEKVNEAASGIDVNSGSAKDVRTGTTMAYGTSLKSLQGNIARTAYGYQVAGANDTYQSNIDLMTGQQDLMGANIAANTTLLGGIGQAGSTFANFANNSSIFGGGSGGSTGAATSIAASSWGEPEGIG